MINKIHADQLRDTYLQNLNDRCNFAILVIENKLGRTMTEEEMKIAKAAFAFGLNSKREK